ncbi:hypothetical protein VNI00_011585 [Paramarasmius palmivorus]|uniref:Uncharacterized protein n=1 Tax=Paramarasmius palmivorus TaxID=297713 RepID=A0AAW0CC27_9AGAR
MDERPQDRLRTILSIQSGEIQGSPYPDLDMLYRQIILTCRNWNKIYFILQLLVTPHPNLNCVSNSRIQWHSSTIIAGLFNFKTGQVETLLSRLHSVMHIPEDPNFQIQILHASFTEFLLDSARSGEHWVRKYSESEYCNHVTVLLLRTLAPYASWYPPYCSSEQSFDAAFAKWQKKVGFIVHSTLPHLSITHWPDYWCKVESPSASLLAELERFDAYLIGALTLTCACNPAHSLLRWNDCLAWAKALDEKVPQSFIEKLGVFSRGCSIGYHKDTLRLNAVRGTFELECGLVNTSRRKFADCMVDSLTWYYKQWWSEELGSWDFLPMLLPATPEDGILFNELVVVHIPKANASTLKKVYGVYRSLKGGAQKTMFRNDIVHDTSKSAVCGLVEIEDLEAFKALLYKRRDIFAVLPAENSSPWSDSDLSVSDGERDAA